MTRVKSLLYTSIGLRRYKYMSTTEIYHTLFHRAYDAIIKQGEPSVTSYGRCKYLARNGMKCAAGHLFIAGTDLKEGWLASEVVVRNGMKCLGLSKDLSNTGYFTNVLTFLDRLQACHDEAAYKCGKVYSGAEFIIRYKANMTRLKSDYAIYTSP